MIGSEKLAENIEIKKYKNTFYNYLPEKKRKEGEKIKYV